jgi:hypothetical protein
MGGGLTQLVLKGQMDSYIIANPCINYYKYVYNRHVNFSMENRKIDREGGETWNLNTNTYNTKTYTFKIKRYGDLISNMYFCFNLPDIYSTDKHRFRWINNIGHNIILSASIKGDGTIIDTIYGDWMNIWNELTNKDGIEYNKLIGNTPDLCGPNNNSSRYTIINNRLFNKTYPDMSNKNDKNNPSIRGRLLQVPLNFWFTRNPSLALPLYKMQTQTLTVDIELRNIEKLYQVWSDKYKLYVSPTFYNELSENEERIYISNFINNESYINCHLDVNYILLESEHRNKSLNEPIAKYVVDYVKKKTEIGLVSVRNNTGTSDNIISNDHIKEIVWVLRRPDIENNFNIYDNYTASHLYNANMGILEKAEIRWASTIIRSDESAYYYNNIQPYQHHTNVPRTGIYCYSFSLFPEKIVSAGSYNNQMINTNLNITIDNNIKNKDEYLYLFKLFDYKNATKPYPIKKEDITFDLIIYSRSINVFSINGGSGNFIWTY